MSIKQEFESLKHLIEADRAILESADSKKATGPLGFISRVPSVRLSAILTGSVTYIYDRLVSGDSPEEIAKRSQTLIKIYTKRTD